MKGDDPNKDLMMFYRETWTLMEQFNLIIEKIPK